MSYITIYNFRNGKKYHHLCGKWPNFDYDACFRDYAYYEHEDKKQPLVINIFILKDYPAFYKKNNISLPRVDNKPAYAAYHYFNKDQIFQYIIFLNEFGFKMEIEEFEHYYRIVVNESDYFCVSQVRYVLDYIRALWETGPHRFYKLYLLLPEEIKREFDSPDLRFMLFQVLIYLSNTFYHAPGHLLPHAKYFTLIPLKIFLEYCEKNKNHDSGSYSLIESLNRKEKLPEHKKIISKIEKVLEIKNNKEFFKKIDIVW